MIPSQRLFLGARHSLGIHPLTSTRCFSPKSFPMDPKVYRGDIPIRFGYEPHHHTKGLLPRLKLKEKRLLSKPITAKEDDWAKHNALKGHNDCIKIFSDTDIEQYELLTHVPDWLRGYYDTRSEYGVLQRKRKEFAHWKYTKPTKWLHLEQRIKFLYRRINNKYKPPDVEKLHPSRHSPC